MSHCSSQFEAKSNEITSRVSSSNSKDESFGTFPEIAVSVMKTKGHHFTHYSFPQDHGRGYTSILPVHGPFQGQMWLIAIHTYSNWPEVILMKIAIAHRTIQEHRLIFAVWGIPKQIISDNWPQFIAEEFQEFTISNGIRHSRVSPYHPKSNGAAERFMQTFI